MVSSDNGCRRGRVYTKERKGGGGGKAHARGHLLAAAMVLFHVGLAKDIVAAVLDAAGLVVPGRAPVPRLGVDVDPDVGRGGDEHVGRDARNGA